jgi:ectoine hydroxylase-related dioxygenase (phytanoyl-CoA dioxygenase family)
MNRKPGRKLTEDDIRRYEEDGVVCLRGMFDPEWVERMHDASVRFMDSGKGRVRIVKRPDETGKFYSNVFMCASDPDFMAFRNESPAAEIAATLMRVDTVRFWYDQLFIKEPATKAPTQWHHDLPYWPFRGTHLISLWVAFTPVDKESSGVEYIAGSHKWGKFYQAVTPDEDPNFTDPTLEPCPNFDNAEYRKDPKLRYLSWSLQPGDVVCHHPLTVHGAGGNKSASQRRIGLSIRFLGDDVQWDPREKVVKIPVQPKVKPGEYPADDAIFPVIWQKGREPAMA